MNLAEISSPSYKSPLKRKHSNHPQLTLEEVMKNNEDDKEENNKIYKNNNYL